MRTLVIGLGHPDRGDDALGLVAAGALAEFVLDGTTVVASSSGLLAHADTIGLADRLIVLDAVRSGAVPGTILRLHPRDLDAGAASFSSHGIGLAAELGLLDRLGHMPAHTVVLGMEIEDVALGSGLSRPVSAALPDLIAAALGYQVTATESTGDMPG